MRTSSNITTEAGTGVSRPCCLALLAAVLARRIIPQALVGFTLDPRTQRFPSFAPGIYIVSLDGYERRFRRLPSVADVSRWLRETGHLLQRPDVFIGGWFNIEDGLFYLDISVSVGGRHLAEGIGRLYGESAIYHPATGTVIPLPRTKAA